jgi:ParB family chromosome partitioning protein
LRAAIKAGWTQVPAQVREANDRLVAELAIVENLQRKDLNPIEKALSFKRYLDEHQCAQEELAQRLKIDRSTIANLMRLLELPDAIIDAVRTGELTAGHARALLPLGDEPMQIVFAEQIREHAWSVREAERQVSQRIAQEDSEPLKVVGGRESSSTTRTRNDQIASLEQELRTALGTKVDIRQNAKGRGKIVIQFTGHDEFERLRSLLTDAPEGPQRQIG